MILAILKILNSIIEIGFLIYAIYCFYKFWTGDKTKNETLWYGLFALIIKITVSRW